MSLVPMVHKGHKYTLTFQCFQVQNVSRMGMPLPPAPVLLVRNWYALEAEWAEIPTATFNSSGKLS